MRMKLSLADESLEFLFFESSRPRADFQKLVTDWVKLVRMCQYAYDQMVTTLSVDSFDESDRKVFQRRLSAIPIVMIQVHCLNFKVAVLDRPHGICYRVRVLETITIPLTLLASQELKTFVYHWLRIQTYINSMANQLLELWQDISQLEQTNDVFFGARPSTISRMNRLTATRPEPSIHLYSLSESQY
jgi:hypothetical protein